MGPQTVDLSPSWSLLRGHLILPIGALLPAQVNLLIMRQWGILMEPAIICWALMRVQSMR